jgi:exodeoxyribonuclease V beta subunit
MPTIINDNFNPEEVALAGSNLIEASAGTGKTYSIALLCLRLIVEKHIPIQKILMVTFTKAAVAELETRVRAFVRLALQVSRGEHIEDPTIKRLIEKQCVEQGNDAVRQQLHIAQLFLDETSVLTIHSFCQRTLSEFSFETKQLFGATTLSPDEYIQIAEDVFNEFWRKQITTIQLPLLAHLNAADLSHSVTFSMVKEALAGKQLASFSPLPSNFLSVDYQLQLLAAYQQSSTEVDLRFEAIVKELVDHKTAYFQAIKKNKSATAVLLAHFEAEDWQALIDTITVKAKNKYCIEIFGALLSDIAAYNSLKVQHKSFFNAIVYQIHIAAIKSVKKAIQQEKIRRGVITYDDMISLLYKALQDGDQSEALVKAMQTKYEAVFIDEFQDTDREQYAIFDRLFKDRTILFYIGDPKQSIYAFRKADINTYFKAKQSVSYLHQMNVNYRSSDAYINAMNAFFLPNDEFDTFSFNEDPILKDAINYVNVAAPGGPTKGALLYKGVVTKPLLWSSHPNKKALGKAVKSLLIDLFTPGHYELKEQDKAARPIRPSDLGILVRSKKEAKAIKLILAQLRIPSVTIDESKLLASDEAQQLYYVLDAAFTCSRSTINKALLTPLGGYSDTAILHADEEVLLQQFKHYQDTWKDKGVYVMLHQFLADYEVSQKLYDPTAEQPERRVVNIHQLVEILHKIAFKKKLHAEELLHWFKKGMEGESREGDEYEQRIESDQDAVQIVTIHKSKGLEYNIVLAPHLDLLAEQAHFKTSSYRDPETGTYCVVKKDYRTDTQKNLAIQQAEQENRRLIYVAITRARYQCFITENCSTYYQSSSLKKFIAAFKERPELLDQFFWELPEAASSFSYVQPHQQLPVYKTAQKFELQQMHWSRTSYSALNPEHASVPLPYTVSQFNDTYDQFVFKELKKGAQTGNLIHYLLEHINFTDATNWSYLIEKSLKRMGIKTSEHMLKQLHAMLDELVHTPLLTPDTFCLQQVSNDKRINELEFDFPLKPFATKQLEQLSNPALPFKIKSIQELEGIMNGKIDLFFEHHQKFYILDWKSNFLGAHITNYQMEHLSAAMEEHNYYLQYLIYTIAVCKYLSIRKKDFNYERDFGGVFYLFVRGVRKDGTTGIFFHKPYKTLLDAIRLVIE